MNWLRLADHAPTHGTWVLLIVRDAPHLLYWDSAHTARLLQINPDTLWQQVNLPSTSETTGSSPV